MPNEEKVKVGIGFATGRKTFRKVLKTNILSWREGGVVENENISLNLFVAYDLKYENTKVTDYTNIPQHLLRDFDSTFFLGKTAMHSEIRNLADTGVLSPDEAQLFFRGGYAGQRNMLLYWAIKEQMDYLLFLDDDEYPMAVTNTHDWAVWSGQHVLHSHLKYMLDTGANITNGYHCGYISPIPSIKFSNQLTKEDFRVFIEAISNDIVNWESLEALMRQGGVTYAEPSILTGSGFGEIPLINKCKFISGSNLCINLKDRTQVHPFYNPPGARGEDTFLSTLLGDSKAFKVPCYTFHDGFTAYDQLMDGVLPIRLRPVCTDMDFVIQRFHRACVGWVRYKPLLLYLTQRDTYESQIDNMRLQLAATLPKISLYLGHEDFTDISRELECYHQNVELHAMQFRKTIEIWEKLLSWLEGKQKSPLAGQ